MALTALTHRLGVLVSAIPDLPWLCGSGKCSYCFLVACTSTALAFATTLAFSSGLRTYRGTYGSDPDISCAFDHIWRLSKQIFALAMCFSSASQLAPQRWQLWIFSLAIRSRRLSHAGIAPYETFTKEFHPVSMEYLEHEFHL
ncbi:hypothetical protein B0I73DRAFT_31633 [Yarrowia lipolytica]|nr:hypothetical protein B0I73DRAFT_31633 [Yarrowia lipolytica]RDW47176.1 hypothetical protein B0I74DRAFT_21397 [Yarrowia lipolytica]RDW53403.1 hypothetical protein B0I75DRAFT_23234 [Yarrowia lipolytica]